MRQLANFFTLLNLASGALAIVFVSRGQFLIACWLILSATVFDGLDGRIARWFGQESTFGGKFDSCADFISFGCAPAFLFYFKWPSPVSFFAGVLFSASSFFRLIRFHRHANGGEYFEGLPTTASGGLIASLVLFLSPLPNSFLPCLLAMFLLSGLMISKIPYPNFKYIYVGLVPVSILLIGIILSGLDFRNQAPIIPMAIFSGYVCFGGLERWLRKKLRLS